MESFLSLGRVSNYKGVLQIRSQPCREGVKGSTWLWHVEFAHVLGWWAGRTATELPPGSITSGGSELLPVA